MFHLADNLAGRAGNGRSGLGVGRHAHVAFRAWPRRFASRAPRHGEVPFGRLPRAIGTVRRPRGPLSFRSLSLALTHTPSARDARSFAGSGEDSGAGDRGPTASGSRKAPRGRRSRAASSTCGYSGEGMRSPRSPLLELCRGKRWGALSHDLRDAVAACCRGCGATLGRSGLAVPPCLRLAQSKCHHRCGWRGRRSRVGIGVEEMPPATSAGTAVRTPSSRDGVRARTAAQVCLQSSQGHREADSTAQCARPRARVAHAASLVLDPALDGLCRPAEPVPPAPIVARWRSLRKRACADITSFRPSPRLERPLRRKTSKDPSFLTLRRIRGEPPVDHL